MVKYYLDTCVWIAYFNKHEKQHAEAAELFRKIIETPGMQIIISRRHTHEMANKNFLDKFNRLKNLLYKRGKCRGVQTTEFDRQIALYHNQYFRLGYGDCLHLQVAKKGKALPISYDNDWHEIGSRIQIRVYLPEELL
ncbi:MAG: PIN domain-containing protein [DPANN group archaeon]|nr:PIN domain-containing protein [DPANN group archaeon]